MKETRKYTVCPSDLEPLGCFERFRDYLKKCGFTPEPDPLCRNMGSSLHFGDTRILRSSDFAEFLETLRDNPRAFPIMMHFHWVRKKDSFAIDIGLWKSRIEVTIGADDPTIMAAVHDKVAEIFSASNPVPDKSPSVSKCDLKRSVFLAHRFDEQGNKTASVLATFVRRLGFDVKEGDGYETRDIPGKVADRIRSQDVFICLVTSGDASWILSETAFAKGLNKYIVLVAQQDVSFSKGIIGGDYEHMSFPEGNVEKVFSDLLYVLPR